MGHSDGIPGNTQTVDNFLSPIASTVVVLLLCMTILIIIMLSIIIYKKSKLIKQQHDFLKSSLSEREQKLITNYRQLNDNGQSIIDTECKALTDNGQTRKIENDGV